MARNIPSFDAGNEEENGKVSILCKFVILAGNAENGTPIAILERRATMASAEEAIMSSIKNAVLDVAKISAADLDASTFNGSVIYTKGDTTIIMSPMDGAPGRDSRTGLIARPAWMRTSNGAVKAVDLSSFLGKLASK